MRNFTLIAVFLSAVLGVLAQTSDEYKAIQIKNNADYVYGEGFAASYTDANNNALNDLISKISTTLTSDVYYTQDASNVNGETAVNTKMETVITSYSQATLTNTQTIVLAAEPQFHILRYISKDELMKIFAHRQDKIDYYVGQGLRAEEKCKVDDALRNLYWAYSYVKSLQYPGESKFMYQGSEVALINWLPDKINEILEGINVSVTDVKDNQMLMWFTYKGKPAVGLDFSFFNGISWTPLHHVKDGIASIELRPGVNPETLKIQYEHQYLGQAQTDKEVEGILTLFMTEPFAKASTSLANPGTEIKHMVSKEAKVEMTNAIAENNDIKIDPIHKDKEYNKSIEAIMKAIGKKDTVSIRPLFTDDGWKMMSELLHYGNASVLGQQEYSFYELYDGRVACRSITMKFAFPNNHKTFTEDVVFTFDTDKLIEGVTFGLGTEAKTAVFDRGEQAEWSEESMLAIVDFLENYKTAFALKRIDYIESIFDDDAYIVTGHVVKRAPQRNSEGMITNLSKGDVEYTHFTKDQYVTKLKEIFDKNEFVNIHFSDNEVVKMLSGGEMYGIQIHQDYYSQYYGDTGYLFLLVDINEAKEPLIKVRFWQPERDPNFTKNAPYHTWDKNYGIVGPYSF